MCFIEKTLLEQIDSQLPQTFSQNSKKYFRVSLIILARNFG